MPLELTVMDMNRPLSESEMKDFTRGEFLKCINTDAQVTELVYVDSSVVVKKCDLNLTEKQSKEIDKAFEESSSKNNNYYGMYLPSKNIVISLGLDSAWLGETTNSMFETYLSDLLRTDPSLFVSASDVMTVEEYRNFAEKLMQA
jgi:hypothetical protein